MAKLQPKQTLNEIIGLVQITIDQASEQGLTTEVIGYAMKVMNEDHSIGIEQALIMGLKEWDI